MSSGEQSDIRFAAETMYRNTQRPQSAPRYEMPVRSHHSAHLDLLHFINEDYIAGYTQDGQMSTVRRFFCLFVSFDLFFISMLWFICIMMRGDTIINALKEQVVHYSIQNSLFDIILAALARFLLLIIFYGVFAFNHWSVIAFTTTASCTFLIAKIFYYDWIGSAQPILQVVMIIVSCLLSWGEAWFLDCRVIPQEKCAQRFYRFIMAQVDANERSPLLDSYLNSNHYGPTESSVANYYTPIESAHDSDSEADENELYRNKGIADIHAAIELLTCIEWKLEKIVTTTGDRIQSIQRKKFGKIYRLTGQVKLPAKELFRKLYFRIDEIPLWNPTVIEARIIKKIDNHTDITYSVSAPGGGGLVDSRDFVNLRCWQLIKNGSIVENMDAISDEVMLTRESSLQTMENSQQLQRSTSDLISIGDEFSSAMNQSMVSLSKSLGAKVLSEGSPQSIPSDMFRSFTNDANEFEKTIESQGAHSTNESSYRSEQDESITEIVSDLCDKMYIMSGASIECDEMPTVSKYTRGENLMGCWAMRESVSDPSTCTFDWIMCLDLKGRFPRFVLDKAYITVMQEFMSHLRKFCESTETLS